MSLFKPSSWFANSGPTTAIHSNTEIKSATNEEMSLDRLIALTDRIENTVAGIRINPEMALKSPSVFAIVTRLSRAVASLPFRVLLDESTPGLRRVSKRPQHSVSILLGRRPNERMTSFEYWTLVMVRLLLWGEFYAEKTLNGGRIGSLNPISPDDILDHRRSSGGSYFEVRDDNGVVRRIPAIDMHVIRAFSIDGKKGLTPVQKCADTIALEIAAQEFGATVFGSGAIPNVILTKEGRFKDEDSIKRLKKSWDDAFGNRKRGTAVLEDGIKVEKVQMSNEESQFLETRKFQRSVIAGAFGIPPHMIGDLERATFSNIEELDIDFVRHALRPHLTCIEQAVDRDLLGDVQLGRGYRSQFDVSEILRGDIKARTEANNIMRMAGVINANEWRAMEGLDAREDPGGDDFITPLNFRIEDASGDSGSAGDGTSVVAMRRIG